MSRSRDTVTKPQSEFFELAREFEMVCAGFMNVIIAWLVSGFGCLSHAAAQSVEYGFENLKFQFAPPADFIRTDDTKTDLAEATKAAVPATNHLFAAYVNRSNLLGREGGAAPTAIPYFLIQTMKAAVTGVGIRGFSTRDQIKKITAMTPGQYENVVDPKTIDQLRNAVSEKSKPQLGQDFKVAKVGMTPIGVVSKSDTHVTILISGSAEYQQNGITAVGKVVGTMTTLEINSLPIMLYVYDLDDDTKARVKSVIQLTETIRKGIR